MAGQHTITIRKFSAMGAVALAATLCLSIPGAFATGPHAAKPIKASAPTVTNKAIGINVAKPKQTVGNTVQQVNGSPSSSSSSGAVSGSSSSSALDASFLNQFTPTNTNSNSQNQIQDQSLENNPVQDTDVSVEIKHKRPLPNIPQPMEGPVNFLQPYLPTTFLNTGSAARPARLTWQQAKQCRGQAFGNDKRSIELVYAVEGQPVPAADFETFTAETIKHGTDKSYMQVLCDAALDAMDDGAAFGVVESSLRAKTHGSGQQLGLTIGGASGTGMSGSLGGGFNWTQSEVKGKIMVKITGFKIRPAQFGR